MPKKVQYNQSVESKLENWALMSWITSKMDLDNKKRKIDWFELKKIILGKVWENQFIYINIYIYLSLFLKFDYKFSSWLLQCFSLNFSPLFPQGSLALYISLWMILILHLSIFQVTTWVLVSLNTLIGPLWVEANKAALFRDLFHINVARELAAEHSMWW